MKSEQSISALMKQISSGQMKSNAAAILKAIMDDPQTEKELSKDLKMPIQTVSARCSDLVDLGLIKGVDVTDTHTIYGYVKDKYEQTKLSQKVRNEKYLAIKKRLKRDFPDYVAIDEAEVNKLKSKISLLRAERNSYKNQLQDLMNRTEKASKIITKTAKQLTLNL